MMGQSKHILVIDDNADVRDVIVDTPQVHNYRVSAATDDSVMGQTRAAPRVLAGAAATVLTFWLNAVFGYSFGGIRYGSNDGHHPRARGEISRRGHQGWRQSALRALRRHAGYGERGWEQDAGTPVAAD